MFEVAGIETEIIAASVRNPIHVTECALAGADIATVPYKVIEQMTHHPLTDAGIEKFKRIILLFLVSNPGNNVKTENGIRMEIKRRYHEQVRAYENCE